MAKDRLADLQRDFVVQVDDEDSETVVQSNSLDDEPPANENVSQFLLQVEEIRNIIENIESLVDVVKTKQSQILAAPTNDNVAREEMEVAMSGISGHAKKVRGKLADMKGEVENVHTDLSIIAEQRIYKSQHAMLSRKFISTMTSYNIVQQDHRRKCKERIRRQLEITGTQMDDEQVEEMLEKNQEGNVGVFSGLALMDTQQSKQALNDIEARHNDIMKLETSIRELHDMFMDMAMMVEQQGEMINMIEHNVTNAEEYVEKATVQLKEAVVMQTAVRKKKLFLIVLFCVIAAVLILVIYFSMPKS